MLNALLHINGNLKYKPIHSHMHTRKFNLMSHIHAQGRACAKSTGTDWVEKKKNT